MIEVFNPEVIILYFTLYFIHYLQLSEFIGCIKRADFQ